MNINRGDIWVVNLDPTVGAEIRKTRPVVVINSDAIGVLPIRLVAPITEWKEFLARNIWHVKIEPDTLAIFWPNSCKDRNHPEPSFGENKGQGAESTDDTDERMARILKQNRGGNDNNEKFEG